MCLTLVACGSSHAPEQPSARLARALGAALAAADRAPEPWRCAAPDVPALPDEQLATGARHWRLGGHEVRLEGAAPTAGATIAVIADAGGAAPPTVAALGRLRARIDQENPDLVVALGGMGATRDELIATLGALADHAGWAVVALPGDLEPAGALTDAAAALRARGDAVIDGRLAQWIELSGATIATIPGAGAVARLAAGGEGCAWRADDVARIYGTLSGKPGLRIAAMAEAPREPASATADATGELALGSSAEQARPPIDLVLHGPSAPAATPARRGGRDGSAIRLSPGTADAMPRLPESGSPSAGLLAIRSGAWTWHPFEK